MTGQDEPVERVDAALDSLQRDIAPPRDLWPSIAARIDAERTSGSGASRRRPRWLVPFAAAAAAVALVAASSLVTATLLGTGQRNGNMAAAPAGSPAGAGSQQVVPAAFGPGYVLDDEYLAARRQLASTLEARIARMPPSARQKLEANLAELHRAASEINAALVHQPGDSLLEELLLNTYQDELAVLASVNQLTSNPGNGAGTKADAKRIEL